MTLKRFQKAINARLSPARPQRVFRGKFVAGLRELRPAGKLGVHASLAGLAAPAAFAAMLRGLFGSDWVVNAKRVEQNIAPVFARRSYPDNDSGDALLGGASLNNRKLAANRLIIFISSSAATGATAFLIHVNYAQPHRMRKTIKLDPGSDKVCKELSICSTQPEPSCPAWA